MPSYDKTGLRFADFAEGVEAAVVRAKRRDPTGKDHATNPSSGVWVLVERLLEQKMIHDTTSRTVADGLTPGRFDSGEPMLARRVDDELAHGFGE